MTADQQVILDAMRRIDPRGRALVPFCELRPECDLLRVEFDAAFLALCRSGVCWMDQHDFPASVPADRLRDMVFHDGEFYVAGGRRVV